MDQLQTANNKKSFREFRVDSICSTSDPDLTLAELGGLDAYVTGKVVGGAKKVKSAAKSGVKRVGNIAKAAGKTAKKGASKAKDALKKAGAKVKKKIVKNEKEPEVKPDKKDEKEKQEESVRITLGQFRATTQQIKEQQALTEGTAEAVIAAMKKIVKDSQGETVKLGDGKGMLVDMTTANSIIKVHGALSKQNKVKFASALAKNRSGFVKMAAFAIKNVSY